MSEHERFTQGVDQSVDHPDAMPKTILFHQALLYWLKLGLVSFGGPAGQISMMHQELVEKRRWISEQRFLHALNYTMVLPGPEAQQLATYIGWLMHGVWGGLVAGIMFVLPSLLMIMALAWVYLVFGDVTVVQGVLYGIKPAVTAIVVVAAYRIGSKTLTNNILCVIACLSFVAIFVFNIAFPYIILAAGLMGFMGSRFLPEKFNRNIAHTASTRDASSLLPAVIGDETPVPLHAKFSWARVWRVVGCGLFFWLVIMAALILSLGWQNALTQMAWFFSKAAMVTFGGAYAVLPYVYQGGVEQYAWITGPQIIDGLALGEATPGPLIMIVAFIGFVGGWTKEIFGPEMQVLAGVAGAGVATVCTFLPSFIFIFLGGPSVEATRGDIKFTAPLMGITAAVVGVIVNLAVFFAYHVLWPEGFSYRLDSFLDSKFEWFSAIIGVLAFIALFKYQIGIVKVIIVCALCGVLRSIVV